MESKFKSYGVVHFGTECDIFVAHKKLFPEASSFLTEAIQKEYCGMKLAEDNNWNQTQTFYKLIPFVKDDAYVVNRIGYLVLWRN
jgi:hypothetical protein